MCYFAYTSFNLGPLERKEKGQDGKLDLKDGGAATLYFFDPRYKGIACLFEYSLNYRIQTEQINITSLFTLKITSWT